MSICMTDDTHVILFEDTGDMPLPIPAFEGRDQAVNFLAFVEAVADTPIAKIPGFELQDLRDRWWEERIDGETGLVKD